MNEMLMKEKQKERLSFSRMVHSMSTDRVVSPVVSYLFFF